MSSMRAGRALCTESASESHSVRRDMFVSRPAQTNYFIEMKKSTGPPDRDGLDCASCCCRATDVCRDISLCIDVVDALSRRCARLIASPRAPVLLCLLCVSVSLCGSLSAFLILILWQM